MLSRFRASATSSTRSDEVSLTTRNSSPMDLDHVVRSPAIRAPRYTKEKSKIPSVMVGTVSPGFQLGKQSYRSDKLIDEETFL